MVRIQVKHGGGEGEGGSEFLYDTEATSSVEEIAKDVTEIANLQSKIERLSLQLEPHISPLLHSDSKGQFFYFFIFLSSLCLAFST